MESPMAHLPPCISLTLDQNGKLKSVSPSYEELTGYQNTEVVGKHFYEMVSEEDAVATTLAIDRSLSDRYGQGTHWARLLRKNDTPLAAVMNLMSMRDSSEAWSINVTIWRANEYTRPGSEPISADVVEQMLSSVNLIVIETDLEGRIRSFSASAESRTGYGADEMIGKKITELMTFGAASEDFEEKAKSTASGETVEIGVRLRTKKNGGSLSLIWRMMAVRGPDRGVIGVIGFGHEIESVRQLDESGVDILDRDLEALVETSKDIVESDDLVDAIDKDLDKFIDFLSVDFGIFRLMGDQAKPRMVCAGMDFKKGRKLLEMRLVGEGALYRDIQAGKTFISADLQADPRVVVEDGEIRAVACLPIKFRNEVFGAACFGSRTAGSNLQGKLPILQVFCNQVAISLRKARLKSELQLRNKELEILYETAMALSSSLDFEKVLDTMMKKAAMLVKADSVHMFRLDKKKNVLVCVSSICDYHNKVMGLELKPGEGITGIVAQSGKGMLIERADKDERSMQIPGTPEDPSSLISVPLKMGEDILGVVTLERVPGIPFNQADFRIIEMFSVMAAAAINNAQLYNQINEHAASQQMYTILLTHDVANYNVPIHGYLEMLAKDPKLDERQRRYILSALAQSENISSLISDVRKLALLRTSQDAEKALETVDLTNIVRECIESLRMNTLYEGIVLNYNPPNEEALVLGDAFVKDIVYNLLSNACKYGGSAPVDIEMYPHLENSYEYWRLDVKDQGEGVPEERRAFLFKRFDNFNVESASEGHGIGLSVVTMLVERLGGKVWVEDREKLDQIKGSVFSVTFPKVRLNIDDRIS
ncbi:MAG: PAS domain S-box protein [Methanomassiliicoccales archaeon]|nr:PAS domain S-box protein [Methanomassiliicoccales archaeon]